MKDKLDGLQCLRSRGGVTEKKQLNGIIMKSSQIYPKITQRPLIHQTDGKRKDAAGGGLKLSVIRGTNNQ